MGSDGAAVCAHAQALDTAPAASSSVAVSWRGGPGVMKPYDLQAQRSYQGAWRDTWLGVHLMTVGISTASTIPKEARKLS